MKKFRLEEYRGGWFIGNFTPTLLDTKALELCVKYFKKGESEKAHLQRTATEYTLVISGACRMGSMRLSEGDILELSPGEVSDFEATEDCVVLGVKTPSVQGDKVYEGE